MIVDFELVVMLMVDEYRIVVWRLFFEKVEIWDILIDDLWCCDFGLLFVIDDCGGFVVFNLNFNGWGGKQVYFVDGVIVYRVVDCFEL